MNLTKQKLYKLIEQALNEIKDLPYNTINWGPMAIYHEDGGDSQSFILYHLTNDPRYPFYIVSYLDMEQTEEPCIPNTYQITGTYTEVEARRKGFSKALHNIAFYIADSKGYGLTSDHLAGTTDVANDASWSKYEKSSDYYKRETAEGNSEFDYKHKTPDPHDDCETTIGDKDPVTNFSFQKKNHGEIGSLFFQLRHQHEENMKTVGSARRSFQDRMITTAMDRFSEIYGAKL